MLLIRSYDDLTGSNRSRWRDARLAKNLSLLRPVEAPRGLTAEIVARLTADITSGKLLPGSRLPTEQEMIAATGVSRTVIREAVAALARRQAGGQPPGHRHFRRRACAPAVPGRFRRKRRRCATCSTSWSCAPASRSRPPALPPSAPRRPRSRRSPSGSPPSKPPSTAARPRSTRISPFIARSPRPPAIRSSRASSNISAASSFRARPCGAARRRC